MPTDWLIEAYLRDWPFVTPECLSFFVERKEAPAQTSL